MGRLTALSVAVLVGAVVLASAGAAASAQSVSGALKERYRLSRIEVQNERAEGRIYSPGSVFVLQGGEVPANQLRFAQINTKSPRFHVHDYARVDVAADGTLTGGSGEFRLASGTKMVALDVKVEGNVVRVFAHTKDPVEIGAGQRAYGCTEFVFHIDPGVIARADMPAIEKSIERVLPLASAG